MTTTQLRHLSSLNDIALASGVEEEFIDEYANSNAQSSFFKILKIPKKGKRRKGQFRIVFKAKEARLAAFHRSISMVINKNVQFEKHVQGFMKRKSTKTNAEQHLARKIVLHADIEGFFDAISLEQVRSALIAHGASLTVAQIISKACTIDGQLRQGTRCAPALANLVCHSLDQSFLHLASSYGCTYTRYADDLTFSGNEVPEDTSIEHILYEHGFNLRDKKCYRQYKGRHQYVTGLSVTDGLIPRLPRQLKRKLRLIMHFIGKYGLSDHLEHSGLSIEEQYREIGWIEGMLQYSRSIEPKLIEQWRETFNLALSTYNPNDYNERDFDMD